MTRFFLRLVPEREAWLPEMRKQIPQLEVVRDLTRDSNETFFLALMESEGEPAVHLEDDVQLTSDFLSKIEPVIAAHPDHVVQFFSLRKNDAELGPRWLAGRTFRMNQCFYLPAGYGDAIQAYYQRWPGRAKGHHLKGGGYDVLMADWLATRGERYWLHVPSLVQHRVVPSVINRRRSSRRQSVTFQL
jgi:hypothetical protein